MEININDSRGTAGWTKQRGVNFVDRWRWWPSLNLICAQLPRSSVLASSSCPLSKSRTRNVCGRRDNFIYTRRKPAAASRRNGRKEGKKKNGKEGEKRKRRSEEDIYIPSPMHLWCISDASENVAQFVSHFIFGAILPIFFSHPESTRRWFPRAYAGSSDSSPWKTTVTWIISIFAPAKVSRRDYRGATRFHPRREEEGALGAGVGRDRIATRLRRLNITVNRARCNSDAGAGATRKHLSR